LLRQLINFNRFSPFRRPDWRFDRILQMTERLADSPGRSTTKDDVYVREMRNFFLRYKNAVDDRTLVALANENPGKYWAFQLHEKTRTQEIQHTVAMIEARILANQDDIEIADDLATIPEVIEWYEAIFFNVRDRLSAHDWILDKVLMPSIDRAAEASSVIVADAEEREDEVPKIAEPFFDATLRFFAYFGGKILLDQILSGFRRGQVVYNRDEINQWLDEHTKSNIRRRSAAAISTFSVTSENVMALFNLHARIIEIEKSTDDIQNKQDTMHRVVAEMLREMPWAVGDQGAATVANTVIGAHDDYAAELRDSELLVTASGHPAAGIELLPMLSLPAPRDKKEDKDKPGAEL
jgi:hypothetical protein